MGCHDVHCELHFQELVSWWFRNIQRKTNQKKLVVNKPNKSQFTIYMIPLPPQKKTKHFNLAHEIVFLEHHCYSKFPMFVSTPFFWRGFNGGRHQGSPPDPSKPAPHYPGVSSIKFDAVGALKVYRTLVEYPGVLDVFFFLFGDTVIITHTCTQHI